MLYRDLDVVNGLGKAPKDGDLHSQWHLVYGDLYFMVLVGKHEGWEKQLT